MNHPYRAHRGLIAMLGGLLAVSLLSACGGNPDTPEARIAAAIDEIVEAVDEHDRGDIMARLDEQFVGRSGDIDRARVDGMLRLVFLRYPEINVLITSREVELISAEQARVQVSALVTGGEGWLPERGQRLQIDSAWVLRDDEWLILNAQSDPPFSRWGY